MTTDATYPTAAPAESSVSAVSWPAIIAGAMIAIAVTLIMVTLGSGLGSAVSSPWAGQGPSATTFSVMTGIWLIVTQWVASAVGGYLTGRLRTRWVGTHTHEVFFRDTAHGFLTWALATVVVAVLAAFAASSAAIVAAHAAAVAPATGPVDASTADAARKAAASFSIFTALSMLVGAFIACVAAALGGQRRDEHP